MQNNSSTMSAQRKTTSRTKDGLLTTVYDNGGAGQPYKFVKAFVVTGGKLTNNFHSPTALTFRLSEGSGSIYRYSRLSGYPMSSYTIVEDPTYANFDRFDPVPTLGLPANWTGLEEEAWQRIYDQVRNGNSNLIVDLAESRETIKMIKNVTNVRKFAQSVLKSVRTQKRYSAADAAKYAGDKWLEGRYGWMPFISSTYELFELLSKRVDKAAIANLKARKSQGDLTNTSVQYVPGFYGTRCVSQEVTGSARVFLKVRMRAKSTLELSDFTSLNPFGIAWELFPLSFVADWFLTIGQTMKLWEDYILFANRFVEGSSTRTYMETYTYDHSEVWEVPPKVWPNGHQMDDFIYQFHDRVQSKRIMKAKDRSVMVNPPIPGGPRVEVKLNAKRMLDAAALLRTVLENFKR